MTKQSTILSPQRYIELFNAGTQQGFNYLYETLHNPVFKKARRAVGDYCIANTIMQESFTRLWLFRSTIRSMSQAEDFLVKEVKKRAQSFYQNAEEQFHRNLVQLDAMASTDWIAQGVIDEEDEPAKEAYRIIKHDWTRRMDAVMPYLRKDQQQLLRLCLQYSFNYKRIAEQLGVPSAREITIRVKKAIDYVRTLFESMQKADAVAKIVWPVSKSEVQLEPEEEQVLFMRMQQRYSFQKIAEEMNLEIPVINKLFVKAYRKKESFYAPV